MYVHNWKIIVATLHLILNILITQKVPFQNVENCEEKSLIPEFDVFSSKNQAFNWTSVGTLMTFYFMGQEGKFFLDLFYSTFHWQKQYIHGRNLKSWPLISKRNMQRWGHPAHPLTASLICLSKKTQSDTLFCLPQTKPYVQTKVI